LRVCFSAEIGPKAVPRPGVSAPGCDLIRLCAQRRCCLPLLRSPCCWSPAARLPMAGEAGTDNDGWRRTWTMKRPS